MPIFYAQKKNRIGDDVYTISRPTQDSCVDIELLSYPLHYNYKYKLCVYTTEHTEHDTLLLDWPDQAWAYFLSYGRKLYSGYYDYLLKEDEAWEHP